MILFHIGNAGFKLVSGDMDTFVDAESVIKTFKSKDETQARKDLRRYIDSKGYETAQSGRSVHVRMPLNDGSYGQVDLFIVPNAEKVAPFHQHGPSGQYDNPGFKGAQLFIMYSSIAKALGLKFSPFEGKLMSRETGEVVADDKDSVAKILLNPNATAADLSNLNTIMKALANDPQRDAKLAQAREDQAKGLITLPESFQPGTTSWFRTISNLVNGK